MKCWAWYVIIITIYTLIFEHEKNDKNLSEGEEIDSYSELVKIILNMVKRENFIKLLKYLFLHQIGFFVTWYILKIYLIDDLKYP